MHKTEKILYFIRGYVPTEEDREKAKQLGTSMFRNVLKLTGNLETCTGVAGAIPEGYNDMENVTKFLTEETKAVSKQTKAKPQSSVAHTPWTGKG